MTELLPCPFCGCDKIEIFHDHENAVGPHLAGYYIHHPLWKTHPETWGCWLNFGGKFDTPELAAEAWNKRTSAENAEMVRVCDSYAAENQRFHDRFTAAEAKLAEAVEQLRILADNGEREIPKVRDLIARLVGGTRIDP